MKHKYVADFETIVNKKETRIWAWGICKVGKPQSFLYGNDMEGFIEWCKEENKEIYFHNLKFDGEFILHWLLNNGYTYSEDKESGTFNTIISNTNQFYQIEIIFKKYRKKYSKVVIRDSLKKLPFTVETIANAFKLSLRKLDLDYTTYREIGHQLTQEEIEYLKNDVVIMAEALDIQFKQGLTRMTIGSDSLNNYKEVIGKRKFDNQFPQLSIMVDNQIRKAYRGGFTYLNDKYKEKDVGEGLVYDVNSLYPYVMYHKPLPYGVPVWFDGLYQDDYLFPLYIQEITCEFTIKPEKLPTIQLKNNLRFIPTEYIKESGMEPVTLFLTNIDMKLFFEHYDVYVHEYRGGYKFKASTGMFDDYINYWSEVKSKNDGAIRQLAKLMLNSLYGKFATNCDVTGKYPFLRLDGSVGYSLTEKKTRDPVYTPVAVFVTSYAREKTIRTAQAVFSRFIYADTDSVHLEGVEEPTNIDIHPTYIGAWKLEGKFTRGRYLRAKSYIEEIDEQLHVTCAGMPGNVKEKVSWDNFKFGQTWEGKLRPKHVKGGVVLEDSTFTLI